MNPWRFSEVGTRDFVVLSVSLQLKAGHGVFPDFADLRDGCLHVTWPDLAHCLQHEVGGKMMGCLKYGVILQVC